MNVHWQYSPLHDEWQLLDCDGGLLAIVGRGRGGYWYWRKKPYVSVNIAKYVALSDIVNQQCGDDIYRRLYKFPT